MEKNKYTCMIVIDHMLYSMLIYNFLNEYYFIIKFIKEPLPTE